MTAVGVTELHAGGAGGSGGYREYPPSAALRPFVECFWSRTTGGVGDVPRTARGHRVLPDGALDIIVGAGRVVEGMAVGTMTRAIVFAAPSRTHLIGARFHPGAAGAFLGVPAAPLTDLQVALGELWPEADRLLDSVAAAADAEGRVGAVERELLRRVLLGRLHTATAPRLDVSAAVRMIERADGNVAIAALAPAIGVTRQHLTRRFTDQVGVAPKTFARVVRVRRVIERARASARSARGGAQRRVDWSALAHSLGYYDQSHLVDEFNALVGLTPTRWLAEEDH